MFEAQLNLREQLGVWLLPLDDTADPNLERACGRLSDDERARFRSYASDVRRREFALCRLLLRTVLLQCGYASLSRTPLEEGAHGKPLFNTDDAPAFNLSHAHGMAVLAIGGCTPVGVDIEPSDRSLPSELLAPRYCHAAELDWLAPHVSDVINHRRHFLRLWVRKEAVLKARGDGVHGGPSRIDSVSTPGVAVYQAAPDKPHEQWKIVDVDAHAHYMVSVACALDSPTPTVQLLEGPRAVV